MTRCFISLHLLCWIFLFSGALAAPEAFEQMYEQIQIFPKNEAFYKDSTGVGHIYLVLPDGQTTPWCTGFALDRHVVVTAKHCIWDKEGKNYLPFQSIEFIMHQRSPTGGETYKLALPPDETGKDLDYVILHSETPFTGDLSIPKVGVDAVPGQSLYIFHYPGESVLTLTRNKCHASSPLVASAAYKSDLDHSCKVESGSSGAPIYDLDFNIVGIHTNGGAAVSTIDGTPYVLPNQGLKISSLMKASRLLTSKLSQPHVASSEKEGIVEAWRESWKVSDGSEFFDKGAIWTIRKGGRTATLILQKNTGDKRSLTFWDPRQDRTYVVLTDQKIVKYRNVNDELWFRLGTIE